MTKVVGYLDEINLWGAVCTGINWSGDTLEVKYGRGISMGGSEHPLASSFKGGPCLFIFEGVVKSLLRVSVFVRNPNIFDRHYFEKDSLPQMKPECSYEEFYLEGDMEATDPQGWFVWNITAEHFIFDDLKPE